LGTPSHTKRQTVGIFEVGAAIAIVVLAVCTSFCSIFGRRGGRDAIAPDQFGERFGLGFLLSPFTSTDFLQQLALSNLALALGWNALGRDAHAQHTVALELEVAAIARLFALEAAGVVVGELDAVFALTTAPTRGHP